MKDYKLTRAEQETVICFSALDKTANIYSCDPVWVRKIKNIKGAHKSGIGYEVDVPKKLLAIRKEIVLSPEQKAKLYARLSKARKQSTNVGRKNVKKQN